LVSDREDPQLIVRLALDDREGKAPAEDPPKGRVLRRSSFRVLHRGPDDGHDLLEELTP